MKKFLSLTTLFLLSVWEVIWFSSIGESVELEGLLLYLPFDEGSGDKAKDLSGKGFDGKLNGPKWVLGKFGKALEFDGKDDFVAVEPIGVDPDEITIELWFSPAKDIDSSSPRMDLVYALKGCCRPCVLFNREKDGGMGFYTEHGGDGAEGPGTDITTKTSSWKSIEWYHFAGTADGNEIKVYANGELEKTMKAPKGLTLNVRYAEFGISIGANQGKSGFFSGKIDELRIWERVLSADEVKKAFDGTLMAIEKKDKLAITWGSIKDMR